jgi:hypothetical protein
VLAHEVDAADGMVLGVGDGEAAASGILHEGEPVGMVELRLCARPVGQPRRARAEDARDAAAAPVLG